MLGPRWQKIRLPVVLESHYIISIISTSTMKVPRSTTQGQKLGVAPTPGNPCSPHFETTQKGGGPGATSCLLKWPMLHGICISLNNLLSVYYGSWILSCMKPRTFTWWPILGLTWDLEQDVSHFIFSTTVGAKRTEKSKGCGWERTRDVSSHWVINRLMHWVKRT